MILIIIYFFTLSYKIFGQATGKVIIIYQRLNSIIKQA